MFINSNLGAGAPTEPPTHGGRLPEHEFEDVRLLLLGTPVAIQTTIALLHKLHYAEPNDWSRPLATGRPNEVMAILTRRVRVD